MTYIGMPQAQQGWQCPVCKYVYSPNTYCCYNCNRPEHDKTKTTTGTDTTITITGQGPVTHTWISKASDEELAKAVEADEKWPY